MRNYKLNLTGNPDIIFFFQNNPIKVKQDKLKELGFYEKWEGYFIKLYNYGNCYEWFCITIIINSEFIRYSFNEGKSKLPCEITKKAIGNKLYNKILNIIREDIKKLKEYDIIK